MFLENIKEALDNLKTNKMRSFLTMLGIIIGIMAVICITTIGNSIRSTLNATMNSLGGNSVEVYLDAIVPDDAGDDWTYPEPTEDDYMSLDMLDGLVAAHSDEISGYNVNVEVGSGKLTQTDGSYVNVTATGATPYVEESTKMDVTRGRFLTERDVSEEKYVCVISDMTADLYFGEDDPIGKRIEYTNSDGKMTDLTVVGVYEYEEAKFGILDTTVPEKERATPLYISVTAAMNMTESGETGFQNATILLQTGADATQAQTDIEDYFSTVYAHNTDWQVTCFNMSSEMGTIDTVINVITIAISFIAAISLIVGGVGVMNIMLVSITERTKEIGIRKALGAKNKAIHQQFLIESVVICLIGCVIGIIMGLLLGVLLGRVATFLINTYYSDYASLLVLNIHPSVKAILLSVGFSALIGIFFGSYPAKKAARMEVIDALRYE